MKFSDRDDIIQITAKWEGERFPDGRPKVSDDTLRRMRNITIEEAWGALQGGGYRHQFEGNLQNTNPEHKMVGRAVTTIMVPKRPDLHDILLDYGHNKEGRRGFFNQWVIDSLVEDDVLVVDLFDKIINGTYVGGNLSTAISTRTKRGGAVIWGGIRDHEQIVGIKNISIYHRGVDPTAIDEVTMTGFNTPTRIGQAICLPGDIVLGTISGVIFIPSHMAERVVVGAEKSHVKDIFGFARLEEKVYSTAQIDTRWTSVMFADFMNWLKTDERAADYAYLDFDKEYEDILKAEKEAGDKKINNSGVVQ